MDASFNLAIVVDDDPDIALAARLALRDMFERIETLSSPAELLHGPLAMIERHFPVMRSGFAACSVGVRPKKSSGSS